jgi:hypothetical protein
MSGVFSMASHAVLQYLPAVASQVQIGCAHFFAGFGVMCFSCFDQGVFRFRSIMDALKYHRCPLTDTSAVRSKLYDCNEPPCMTIGKTAECQSLRAIVRKAKKRRAADVGRPLSGDLIAVSE